MSNNNDLLKLEHVLQSYVSGKVVSSLEKLLGERIDYKIERTRVSALSEIEDISLDSEKSHVMAAVYARCEGDIHMAVLWYVPENESRHLTSRLLGEIRCNEYDGLSNSSILEIGNILTANIASALYDQGGHRVWSSLPGFAVESLKVLVEAALSDFDHECNFVISSAVEFHGVNSGINLQMILIQDQSELDKLLVKAN